MPRRHTLELDRQEPAGAFEKYLDSWRGLGDVIVGMRAQGFDVELRQLGEHWRANFLCDWDGTRWCTDAGWEARPWRAVSRATWAALRDPRIAA